MQNSGKYTRLKPREIFPPKALTFEVCLSMRKIQTHIPCYIEAGIKDVNKATNKETYQLFGSLLSRFARF